MQQLFEHKIHLFRKVSFHEARKQQTSLYERHNLTGLKVTYARTGERGTACFKYMYVTPMSGDRKPTFENSNYHGKLKFSSRVLSH